MFMRTRMFRMDCLASFSGPQMSGCWSMRWKALGRDIVLFSVWFFFDMSAKIGVCWKVPTGGWQENRREPLLFATKMECGTTDEDACHPVSFWIGITSPAALVVLKIYPTRTEAYGRADASTFLSLEQRIGDSR